MLSRKDASHRLVVWAQYNGGTDHDMTRLAVFAGNNAAAATVYEGVWLRVLVLMRPPFWSASTRSPTAPLSSSALAPCSPTRGPEVQTAGS